MIHTTETQTQESNTQMKAPKPECLHKFKEKPDTTHEAYTEVTSEDDSDLPF